MARRSGFAWWPGTRLAACIATLLAACSSSSSEQQNGGAGADGSGNGNGGSTQAGTGGAGGGTGAVSNAGGSGALTNVGGAPPEDKCPDPFEGGGDFQISNEAAADSSPTVPLFVAFGHGDRTMVSCDDGKTWMADQYCSTIALGGKGQVRDRFSEAANRAMGFGYTKGHFIKYVGWNGASYAMRSQDGVSWELVMPRSLREWVWHGDAGGGVFSFTKRYSDDLGETWKEPDEHLKNKPRTYWGDYEGGRWVAFNSDGEVVYSTTGAASWLPADLTSGATAACFKSSEALAFGNERFVAVGDDGTACWSADGGESWSGASNGIGSDPKAVIWHRERFLAFLRSEIWESADGSSWKLVDDASGMKEFASVARSDSGTLVAVEGNSLPVSSTFIHRSEDGIHWNEMEVAQFPSTGGDLRWVRFGNALKPAACE